MEGNNLSEPMLTVTTAFGELDILSTVPEDPKKMYRTLGAAMRAGVV
jgi:hypothetical protein